MDLMTSFSMYRSMYVSVYLQSYVEHAGLKSIISSRW